MTACPWDADRLPSLHPDGEVIIIPVFLQVLTVYFFPAYWRLLLATPESSAKCTWGGNTPHPNIPSRWRFEIPRSTKLLASSGTYIIPVDKRGIQKRFLGGIRNGDLIPITEVTVGKVSTDISVQIFSRFPVPPVLRYFDA